MNILVPVADFGEYNTARYVIKALVELGHEARWCSQGEFYEDHPNVDGFFGVDSSGPLDFPEKHLSKTAMWFIDSRHNNDPARRTPDDDTNARKIYAGGGWVFQSQKPDWKRNVEQGTIRSSWLPLAADPDVWRPYNEEIVYDLAFGGNVWDGVRGQVLEVLCKKYSLKHTVGTPEELAKAYSQANFGFNISSFYGSDVDYDINMRVFEVMSCGRPLITNYIPEIDELGMLQEYHYYSYNNLDSLYSKMCELLNCKSEELKTMGGRARQLILEGHTYKHRMVEAIELLQEVIWPLN